MKRPTKVTLDQHTCRIQWSPKEIGRLSQGYRVSGEHEPGLIRIGPGLSRRYEKVTLLHELLHEVFNRARVKLPMKQEEYVLNNIDEWVYLMLRDNPALVAYLTEEAS